MKTIDITFDVYSDTPLGKDPDSYSLTLRGYHKYLWDKPLPNGVRFLLSDKTPKLLHHKSDLGEFFLSSDSIGHTYGGGPTGYKVKSVSHILDKVPRYELEKFFKDKEMPLDFNNNSYIYTIINYIKNASISDKEREAAIQLYHKINQTLQVKTDYYKTENEKKNNKFNDDFTDNVKLAIESLLDAHEIEDRAKILLRKLCDHYVTSFIKNIKENRLYGYNYNIFTFEYFDRNVRLSSNKAFIFIIRLISTYVLFARPFTSPWLFSIFSMIGSKKYQGFNEYFKYFTENNSFMKYLSMGIDHEYFYENYKNDLTNLIKDKPFYKKALLLLFKFLITVFITLPVLQVYNNAFYGLTGNPSYINLITILVFLIILGILYNVIKN